MKFCDCHAIEQCANEILPCIFYILHLTWIKFNTDMLVEYFFTSWKPTCFTCMREFLFVTYSSHLLSDLGKFCVRDLHQMLLSIYEFGEWAQRRAFLFRGRKLNYRYTCTVKPRDILKVKLVFVKHVCYHVPEHLAWKVVCSKHKLMSVLAL
jgi:hypothetical protein